MDILTVMAPIMEVFMVDTMEAGIAITAFLVSDMVTNGLSMITMVGIVLIMDMEAIMVTVATIMAEAIGEAIQPIVILRTTKPAEDLLIAPQIPEVDMVTGETHLNQ